MSFHGLRAVFFDLDGTLRHTRPIYADFFAEYVVGLGLPDSNDNRLRAMRWEHHYWAQSVDLLADLVAYPEMETAFWQNYARRRLIAFGCPPKRAEALSAQVAGYIEANRQPVGYLPEDVLPTLQALREQQTLVGVISNRMGSLEDVLAEIGLDGLVDFSLASGQLDSWKPDPAIFAHALDQLGMTPEQTIYVGDNYFADVVGARRAGIQPVLLDPRRIFHDPGCPVIDRIGAVLTLIEH